jgi:hypothetical protein
LGRKPNYGHEKRQREKLKQQKKAEKAERKRLAKLREAEKDPGAAELEPGEKPPE